MKKNKELLKLIGQALMMLVAVVVGGLAAMAAMTNPVHVDNVPEAEVTNPTNQTTTDGGSPAVFPEQSVTTGQAAAPEVYEDQYDKLITEIRIARTPLDQISRRSRRKSKIKAMEFKYGTVDYLPIKTTLATAYTVAQSATSAYTETELVPANPGIFNRRDIIICQGIPGYKEDGATQSGEDLKLWVKNRDGNTKISVIAINGKKIGNFVGQVPTIAKDTVLIRIAKACAELDSQAPGYAVFPTTDEQYCQKFMAQVEQSTIDALTAKRFDITLADQEEAVLADMRLGMEGAFLFGSKSKFVDPDTMRNVWTTKGIWNMAEKEFTYTASTDVGVNFLIDMARTMFTGPAAGRSDKRIVLCGSKLLSYVQKSLFAAQYTTNVFKKWDLEFTEFRTVFGSFEFILDEVFDLHSMDENGLIIDADYLERYTLEPFGRNTIDLDAQGTRDSKATVLREISAMVLKSPKNHARIVKTSN